MLCAQNGFHYYKADDYESEHMRRSQPDVQPISYKYSKMNWDQIWSQSPETLLADEIKYYDERFHFILDDLQQLPSAKPVILEGAAFLPKLVDQFPIVREHVIFMVPTREFQLHYYSKRPWIHAILNECHDPKAAFHHWMERDVLFGEEVIRQATNVGLRVIRVDGSVDIPAQFQVIQNQFGLKAL
jgi:hypothetical protein